MHLCSCTKLKWQIASQLRDSRFMAKSAGNIMPLLKADILKMVER